MKSELTISPDAFNTLVKLKEELEDVIETIEIMNELKMLRRKTSFFGQAFFLKERLLVTLLKLFKRKVCYIPLLSKEEIDGFGVNLFYK